MARLGLLDGDGRPRVLPVTFALAEGAAWSAVDYKPKQVPGGELARVRWLRERPDAALTVDRYDDDWSRLAWVQLLGTMSVLREARQDRPASRVGEGGEGGAELVGRHRHLSGRLINVSVNQG